jgi:hypothetical protein
MLSVWCLLQYRVALRWSFFTEILLTGSYIICILQQFKNIVISRAVFIRSTNPTLTTLPHAMRRRKAKHPNDVTILSSAELESACFVFSSSENSLSPLSLIVIELPPALLLRLSPHRHRSRRRRRSPRILQSPRSRIHVCRRRGIASRREPQCPNLPAGFLLGPNS